MEIQKAMVTISGVYRNGDTQESDNIQLASEGKFGKKGRAFRIEYNESALTGMAGTHTTIIANQSTVAMKRTGSVESYMFFSRGRKQTAYYTTQYGSFEMAVAPFEMDIALNEKGGYIHVGYHVEMNHIETSVNTLDIQVRPIYD